MAKYFDAHIHLNSPSLQEWLESNKFSEWIFNNISTNIEDFRIALEQAKKYSNVYLTAGIHPLEINNLNPKEVIEEFKRELASFKKCIAIGEIGLDFYRYSKEEVFEKQKEWFLLQCNLAKELNLPVILHIRNAHQEALDLLSTLDNYGVIHCFEGTLELAKKYLALKNNWMLSISPLAFREGSNLREVVRGIDISKLLVETDAPYLCKNNETIKDIISLIAEEKGITFEACRSTLLNNFYSFFKWH